MHANLSELLELRDGEGRPDVVEHVAACASCAAELRRLEQLRDELRALPVEGPGRDLWPSIVEGAAAERDRRRWIRVGWAVAVLAVVITLVAGVRGVVETVQEARISRETSTLVAESARLERQLRDLERRDRLMNGREASMVAELEDRLAVVDARLTGKQVRTGKNEDAVNLWHERVQLLDALVDVHRTRASYAGL